MEREYTEDEIRRMSDEWFACQAAVRDETPAGDDLSLLRENLRRTPTERMLHYERAARLALEFFDAGKRAGLHRLR